MLALQTWLMAKPRRRSTVPCNGFNKPNIVRSSVVLPEPFGPTIPRISPRWIFKGETPEEGATVVPQAEHPSGHQHVVGDRYFIHLLNLDFDSHVPGVKRT